VATVRGAEPALPSTVKRARDRLTGWVRAQPVLLPLAILLACWLPGAAQGWFRTDSHYYAAIGLSAWRTGSLWNLHVGESLYLNKPPLVFWIHGLFMHLLGPSLLAGRLPSLLFAGVTVWATVRTARLLAGPGLAIWSGIVLASTLEFFRYTKAISLDMTQCAMLSLATLAVVWAVKSDRGSRVLWAGVPIGLGLLCKPLMALLGPALLAVWLVSQGRSRWLGWMAGAGAVALAVAAPWHAGMWLEHGETFVRVYFVQQSLERAGEVSDRGWWYYLHLLVENYWPWLGALGLTAALALRGRLWSGRADAPANPGRRGLAVLAVVIALGWLVALSAFGGKAGRYALPVYPGLAMLCAVGLTALPRGGLTRPLGRALPWLAPAVLAGGIIAAALPVQYHEARDPAWDRVVEAVNRAPQAELLSSLGARPIAANTYLLLGQWAGVAPAPEAGWETAAGERTWPATGSLLVVTPADATGAFARVGETVASSGDFVLLKVTRPYRAGPPERASTPF